jgi:hypothetical protein
VGVVYISSNQDIVMEAANLYWSFNTNEFQIITIDNNYCKEEEILGERLYDYFCNNALMIPENPSFTDWGFVFDFKYQDSSYVFIIKCINVNDKLFGVMVYNKNLKKKIINYDELLRIIDEIIHLDTSCFNIRKYTEENWIKNFKTKNIWEIE